MKRTSFALAAALALVVNACEKHPAAETRSALHEHSESAHEAAGHAAEGGAPEANPTPHAPEGVALNPAGSGPAEKRDPALDKGQGGKEPGAVKYFPEGEKK